MENGSLPVIRTLRALKYSSALFQDYGIPKHFGLFYAMGIALMMEGVLSACYHVCPNYSNFQFGKLSFRSPFELELGFAMFCLLLSC